MANPSDILPDKPVYDAEAHHRRVLALYDDYPIKDNEAAQQHAADIVIAALRGSGKRPSDDFALALASTVETTFEHDKLYWSEAPRSWGLAESERLLSRERLEAATQCMTALLTVFLREFCPQEAFAFAGDPDQPGIPLIEMTHEAAELVHGFCVDFINLSSKDSPVFPKLRQQLVDNLLIANGLAPDAPLKPGKVIKFPKDFNLEPRKLVTKFMRNTSSYSPCLLRRSSRNFRPSRTTPNSSTRGVLREAARAKPRSSSRRSWTT